MSKFLWNLRELAHLVNVIGNSWIHKTAPKDAPDDYHRWYFETQVFKKVCYLGLPTRKSVSDLWNYQEIIFEIKPTLIVELGTFAGGSALYFSHLLKAIKGRHKVFTVDVSRDALAPEIMQDPDIEFMLASSCSDEVAQRIEALRQEFPGPMFVILDSDHSKKHVLAEMIMLRTLMRPCDYLIVEDSNINGHPVSPGWGDGPYEAIEEYEKMYPGDYRHDDEREKKFGFTFAVRGFLIRN
jgi:cephalosporin hydroxylase